MKIRKANSIIDIYFTDFQFVHFFYFSGDSDKTKKKNKETADNQLSPGAFVKKESESESLENSTDDLPISILPTFRVCPFLNFL